MVQGIIRYRIMGVLVCIPSAVEMTDWGDAATKSVVSSIFKRNSPLLYRMLSWWLENTDHPQDLLLDDLSSSIEWQRYIKDWFLTSSCFTGLRFDYNWVSILMEYFTMMSNRYPVIADDDLDHHTTVKVIILSRHLDSIFLQQDRKYRVKMGDMPVRDGRVTVPGGFCEPGDARDFAETLRREFEEETDFEEINGEPFTQDLMDGVVTFYTKLDYTKPHHRVSHHKYIWVVGVAGAKLTQQLTNVTGVYANRPPPKYTSSRKKTKIEGESYGAMWYKTAKFHAQVVHNHKASLFNEPDAPSKPMHSKFSQPFQVMMQGMGTPEMIEGDKIALAASCVV